MILLVSKRDVKEPVEQVRRGLILIRMTPDESSDPTGEMLITGRLLTTEVVTLAAFRSSSGGCR
jgi:hypothetical protein